MSETAYILLGSNLGNREARLDAAVQYLGDVPGVTVTALSSVYETAPQEMTGNPPLFLNQAVAVDTTLSPLVLLTSLERIERRCGRTRKGQYQSRTIDLDILYFGRHIIATEVLTIPHPRVLKRSFALVPLVELAPDLIEPVTGRPVIEYLAAIDTTGVQLYRSRVAHAV